MSATAEDTTRCPIEPAPPARISKQATELSPNQKRSPNHSPSSSYSSSSSCRHPRLCSHHQSPSQSSGHPSIGHLPIGVGRPHIHSRDRTPSGSSSNGHGYVSRTVSLASSVQPGVTVSLATLAPTRARQELLPENVTRSTVFPSASMRSRSHSNAIPTSMKQFHLPTGMIHRSQSHAQLRDGASIPSHELQSSKGPLTAPSPLSVLGSAGVAPRLARKLSKSVVSPSISRSHSHAPSYASASFPSKETREEPGDSIRSRRPSILHSHIRQTSEILDKLESRVPSLSSSFSRNAVYIDSEDISERLDELLSLAKEEMERSVVEEDENEDEEGTVEAVVEGMVGEHWVDMVKGHGCSEGSIDQQTASPPPNTPATGYFGSALSVAGSQTGASSGCLSGGGIYTSPEAGSSRVYLGSNPISHNHSMSSNLNIAQTVVEDHAPPICASPALPLEILDPDATIREDRVSLDLVPQQDTFSVPMSTPTPPERMEDEEVMEEALAVARELAGGMVWTVRRSFEMMDDCWGEFEDEEMGVGVCTLRMSVGPGPYGTYGGSGEGNSYAANDRVKSLLADGEGHGLRDSGLAPPSISKWSLTSSIDDEKQDGKQKKEKKRRSFVPFISGDRDKDKDDGSIYKENGTVSKKRSRLASFISRLSNVGLGGSGSNTPSTRTPPLPMLSASNSSHALFSPSVVPSKWDSPSLPALTPNFSATPSRSSSPTGLLDPPLQRQPPVTIVAEDDASSSSPSSSRLVLSSFHSTPYDSTSQPLAPPPQIISSMTSIRPIPPGIVIPPLPKFPPPQLPPVLPLGKAASEGMINADSPPFPFISRPRSNSTTGDLSGKHVTFTGSMRISSSSPRIEPVAPSTLRRSVLAKSASASVLGLHQQLKPVILADMSAGGYDDVLVPPTPTSLMSTEEFGELHRRDDGYDDGHGLQPKRPRLRAMSSLGALTTSGTSKSKGGLKGFVGRLTGRGKNSGKASPAQVHISPSFLDDPAIVSDYRRTPSPKHSPTGSSSTNVIGGNSTAVPGSTAGVLTGFKLYLERTPFRQT